MLPGFAMDQVVYGRRSNAEFLAKLLLGDATCRKAFAYRIHDGFRKLGTRHTGATLLAGFCHLILHVLSATAQKKVVGANARRVVAVMAGVHPIGDGAVSQQPSGAMGVHLSSVASPKPETTVSLMVRGTLPQPATIALLHLAPKALFNRALRTMLTGPVACLRAKLAACWVVGAIRLYRELSATLLTLAGNARFSACHAIFPFRLSRISSAVARRSMTTTMRSPESAAMRRSVSRVDFQILMVWNVGM